MTPQLQQAIRLLQLSTLDLRTEVQQALESNMMLEAEEDGPNGAGEPGKEHGLDGEADVLPADIPQELPVDSAWDDIYDNVRTGPPRDETGGGADIETHGSAAEDLRDHLYWQMGFARFSDTDKLIATAIIDAIDDDGYLRLDPEEILEGFVRGGVEADADEVQAVLHRIQSFDPVGVGACDLQDCLCIQLRHLPGETPWRDKALDLVERHLELLGKKNYAALMRRMNLGPDELRETVSLVQSLNPRPGAQIQAAPAAYVVPDVFVRKHKGRWLVELNTEAVPRLRINAYYAGLVRRADSSEDNTTLRAHLQEARWFLKSLHSRNETLLKVATCIVERQQAFLEYGEEAMKPMVLHDIAETVDMHDSTISRVTTQKYMHTPRGIFELKYFFSSHVTTQAGGEASSTAIRALLKKLIEAENTLRPLSDNKLAAILSDQGINVARRTVAKYREAMSIPSSNERKRLA